MPSTRPSAPETLGPLGLDAHGRPEQVLQAARHLIGVLGQAGALAHDGAVGVHEVQALELDHRRHLAQQLHGVRSGPGGVAGREMPSQVPESRRPQKGLGHGVSDDVRIAVAGEPRRPRHRHAAQDERSPRIPREPVDVEALSDP